MSVGLQLMAFPDLPDGAIPIPAFPSLRFTVFIAQSPYDYMHPRPLSWYGDMIYLSTSQTLQIFGHCSLQDRNEHRLPYHLI